MLAREHGERPVQQGESRGAPRALDDPLGGGLALDRVRREQLAGSLPGDHGGQLPTEVEGILDTDVQPLGTDHRVHVGGVTGQEDPTGQLFLDGALVDDKPRLVADLHDPCPLAGRRHPWPVAPRPA